MKNAILVLVCTIGLMTFAQPEKKVIRLIAIDSGALLTVGPLSLVEIIEEAAGKSIGPLSKLVFD